MFLLLNCLNTYMKNVRKLRFHLKCFVHLKLKWFTVCKHNFKAFFLWFLR